MGSVVVSEVGLIIIIDSITNPVLGSRLTGSLRPLDI